MQEARWVRAGHFAAAYLVLDPSDEAMPRSLRARTGEKLRTELADARAAARRGQWRTALRMALAVVAVRKDFPGAAALVADARVALTPKPKPPDAHAGRRSSAGHRRHDDAACHAAPTPTAVIALPLPQHLRRAGLTATAIVAALRCRAGPPAPRRRALPGRRCPVRPAPVGRSTTPRRSARPASR